MGNRANSIDYASQCTVCIDYQDQGAQGRIVYERPQMQIPNRPLTPSELLQIARYPNDEALTKEAKTIFLDLQRKGSLTRRAKMDSIFIVRSAAAALEMEL